MKTVTNTSNIALPIALWIVTDNYDYNPDLTSHISATTLIKPLRHIVLRDRADAAGGVPTDVRDRIKMAMGNALHSAIESAWLNNYATGMKILGYSPEIIDSVVINPPEPIPNKINIFMERRSSKKVGNVTISGKFDFVGQEQVHDFKKTSPYTAMHGNRNDEHILQGSIYRWLNPTLITQDTMMIHYVFEGWQQTSANSNPAYPQLPIVSVELPLMSLDETQAWIEEKLALIEQYKDADETTIPHCTEEELWRSKPVFKYYGTSNTSGRATKNFNSAVEAQAYLTIKGKGTVIKVESTPRRCEYCPVYNVCTQREAFTYAMDDADISTT